MKSGEILVITVGVLELLSIGSILINKPFVAGLCMSLIFVFGGLWLLFAEND